MIGYEASWTLGLIFGSDFFLELLALLLLNNLGMEISD